MAARIRLVCLGLLASAVIVIVAQGWRHSSTSETDAQRRLPAGGSEALLFTEEHGTVTDFWFADAVRPSVRSLRASVTHRAGWAGQASVAPNGRFAAYTRLPPDQSNPDGAAELWLLPISSGQSRRLATSLDLRSVLVWSPTSDAITFARVGESSRELWRASTIAGQSERLLAGSPADHVLIPAGYAREGATLVCADFGRNGVDAVLLRPDGGTELIAHLSDSVSRAFTISPDQARLAYLAVAGTGGTAHYQAHELDLDHGTPRQVGAAGSEDVGLVWRPDGALVIGSVGVHPGLRSSTGVASFPPVETGFEQPLAWSPSGERLAIRAFSGASSAEPGSSRELIIEPDGTRLTLSATGGVRFVGWLRRGA